MEPEPELEPYPGAGAILISMTPAPNSRKLAPAPKPCIGMNKKLVIGEMSYIKYMLKKLVESKASLHLKKFLDVCTKKKL